MQSGCLEGDLLSLYYVGVVVPVDRLFLLLLTARQGSLNDAFASDGDVCYH